MHHRDVITRRHRGVTPRRPWPMGDRREANVKQAAPSLSRPAPPTAADRSDGDGARPPRPTQLGQCKGLSNGVSSEARADQAACCALKVVSRGLHHSLP